MGSRSGPTCTATVLVGAPGKRHRVCSTDRVLITSTGVHGCMEEPKVIAPKLRLLAIVRYGRQQPLILLLEALPLYDAEARLKSQAHWQTDVIAAWLVGTGIGYWATTLKATRIRTAQAEPRFRSVGAPYRPNFAFFCTQTVSARRPMMGPPSKSKAPGSGCCWSIQSNGTGPAR